MRMAESSATLSHLQPDRQIRLLAVLPTNDYAAWVMASRAHTASSCRMAALRSWSPAGVNREPLTRPIRVKVRSATEISP
jgi:hypothetical protein